MLKQSLLIIDQEKDLSGILLQWAKSNDFELFDTESIEQALCLLNNQDIDIVLVNFCSSNIGEITIDEYLVDLKTEALIIFLLPGIKELNQIKNTLGEDIYDYIIHPIDLDQLSMSLNRGMKYKKLQKKYQQLKAKLNADFSLT